MVQVFLGEGRVMENITFGFSRPKTWKAFATLIMKAYGIPYDHVYVRFYSDRYSRGLIYQASQLTVNFMGQLKFDHENITVESVELEISDELKTRIMQFAIDNVGKPYGIKEAFGLGIVRVAAFFGKTIKNPFSDGKTTYVCSGLAAVILKEFFGADLPKDPDDMTPKDLLELLQSIKNDYTIDKKS